MNPIRLEFQFTRKELFESMTPLMHSISRRLTIPRWIGVGLMVVCILAVTWQRFPISSLVEVFFLSAMLVILPPLLPRAIVTLAWRKLSFADKSCVWLISREGLHSEFDGVKATFDWDKITHVEEMTEGIILFTSPILGHWLPRHAFASGTDIDALRTLIQEKGIKYKR